MAVTILLMVEMEPSYDSGGVDGWLWGSKWGACSGKQENPTTVNHVHQRYTCTFADLTKALRSYLTTGSGDSVPFAGSISDRRPGSAVSSSCIVIGQSLIEYAIFSKLRWNYVSIIVKG